MNYYFLRNHNILWINTLINTLRFILSRTRNRLILCVKLYDKTCLFTRQFDSNRTINCITSRHKKIDYKKQIQYKVVVECQNITYNVVSLWKQKWNRSDRIWSNILQNSTRIIKKKDSFYLWSRNQFMKESKSSITRI